MYPFFVLDLPEEATDAEVEARYRDLARAFPPEASGDAFRRIRAAYEATRTLEKRMTTRLTYWDHTGLALAAEPPPRLPPAERLRVGPEELAALIRRTACIAALAEVSTAPAGAAADEGPAGPPAGEGPPRGPAASPSTPTAKPQPQAMPKPEAKEKRRARRR